jgi:hypothetical protein
LPPIVQGTASVPASWALSAYLDGFEPVEPGIWMHGKAQADQWQRYIRETMAKALSGGSAWLPMHSTVGFSLSALGAWAASVALSMPQVDRQIRPRGAPHSLCSRQAYWLVRSRSTGHES